MWCIHTTLTQNCVFNKFFSAQKPETAVVVDIQHGRFKNFTDNVIKLSDDETKWTGLLASENNRAMFSGPEKLPGLN